MAANVLVFIWTSLSNATASSQRLVEFGALYGPAVAAGQWWRIFTGAFIHDGIMHIAFNMFALWQIGMLVEQLFGSPKMAFIYFVSMIGSGLAVYYLNYNEVTIGASGAIFGLFGALVAAGLRLGEVGRRLVRSMLGVVLINLLIGFMIPNISMAGHVGGLITGFLIGMPLFVTPAALRRPPHVPVNVQTQSGEGIDAELLPPPEGERK